MSPTSPLSLTAIDLETTGLAVAQARIVQIGIVCADEHGVERDAWSALIAPLVRSLPAGFAPPCSADVRASSFAEIADEVLSRLTGATLVAHNAAFDLHLLVREFALVGRAWWPGRVRCTLTLAQARHPGLPSYRLGDLAAQLGLPPASHEALADARSALALYRALTTRGREPD